MNIIKIIACSVSVASVGFATDSLFDGKENPNRGSVGFAVKPVKRERPAGGDVSASKFMLGVDRVLVDVTNTVGTRPVRDRKPNTKFMQDDHLDGQSDNSKATAEVLKNRIIAKAKRKKSSRKSPAAVVYVLSDSDNSGHTTPVEEFVGSRTSSFDSSGVSSPVLGSNDDVVEGDVDALNQSFGDDFGFNFAEEVESAVSLLVSPAAATAPVAVAPQTPEATELDWRLARSALGKDATPFEMGGSYKGQIYTPFDLNTYTDLLAKDPLSPIGQAEFEKLIAGMCSEKIIF